ncbi:MAG: hypothetical protein AAGA64_11425 [Bacteroidota bacterium]
MSKNIFILLSRQRSGTQMFRDLIRAHPDISITGEIFHSNREGKNNSFFNFLVSNFNNDLNSYFDALASPKIIFNSFLESILEKSKKEKVLIDVKYSSVHHFEGFWKELNEESNLFKLIKKAEIGVVHLIRENYLENYCSALLAKVNQNWSAYDSERKVDKIYVNTGEMLDEISKREQEVSVIKKVFSDYAAYKEIVYEEILDSSGNFSESLQHELKCFFDINQSHDFLRRPRTNKTAKPLKSLIENYDEVKSVLSVSEFSDMLD